MEEKKARIFSSQVLEVKCDFAKALNWTTPNPTFQIRVVH